MKKKIVIDKGNEMVLGQLNLGTNDLERSEAFFSEFLSPVGGSRLFKTDRAVIYSVGESGARLCINKPYDGEPATNGNGTMAALFASSKEEVNAGHARAIALGATCGGEPGDRLDGIIYAAYFHDLDGNKFGLIYMADSE